VVTGVVVGVVVFFSSPPLRELQARREKPSTAATANVINNLAFKANLLYEYYELRKAFSADTIAIAGVRVKAFLPADFGTVSA